MSKRLKRKLKFELIDNAKIVGFGVGDIDFYGGAVVEGGSRRV